VGGGGRGPAASFGRPGGYGTGHNSTSRRALGRPISYIHGPWEGAGLESRASRDGSTTGGIDASSSLSRCGRRGGVRPDGLQQLQPVCAAELQHVREAELQHVREAEVQHVREAVQHVREAVPAAALRLRRPGVRASADAGPRSGPGPGSGSLSTARTSSGDRTAAASKDACRDRPVPVSFGIGEIASHGRSAVP